MARAVLYLRQSLDRHGEELGVQRQEAECHRLCVERGYQVVQVITDNNRSASSGDRPGYREVLDLMENRAVDVVVVLKVDRLLRKLTDLEALIELIERTGVQIATVHGDLDLTSSSGRLIGRVLASVARAEIEAKSERHILANAQKAALGRPHGTMRAFGYNRDAMTLYEPEAAALREMGRRVIAGHSYREVAYWLNEQGHTTTTGKPFLGLTVRNMLMKKRYAAIREYKGAEYPGIWTPVFDAETWEQLQLTMRLRRDGNGQTLNARKYLLTGLLYCGKCGQALNGSQNRDRPGAPMRRRYVCQVQGATRREGGCGGTRRNADALEDFITECVLYRLDTPDLGKLLEQPGDDGEIRALLASRQAAQARVDGLVDDYAMGLLDRAQLARAKATAESELQRIERELEAANRSRRASGLLPVGESVRATWETSESDSWRRALLGLLIKRIVVNPGNTKPYYVTRDGRRFRFDPKLIQIEWLA